MSLNRLLPPLAAALALAGLQTAASAAIVAMPVVTTAKTNLKICNPKINLDTPQETQDPAVTTCKVNGLPGSAALPGYILKSSRTQNIVANGVVVGTLYDRVWCAGTGTTCNATQTYFLGMRARMNANPWNPTGFSFEINDFFRTIRSAASADIGYFMGTVLGGTSPDTAQARKYLEFSGRTLQGLFEPAGSAQNARSKTTNNAWMDFRVDTNIDDDDANPPYSYSSEWSPWLLVRQNCPSGYNPTAQALKTRLWQGGEEGQTPQAILTSAYVCN
ncbi:MAG TPA: hypothetical protein VLA16_26505 [Ideonella sp.]|nr:hypothetical protein [Ideonella sp.]